MLIPGVYIKGNDLAGMLNGKIKALLEKGLSVTFIECHQRTQRLYLTSCMAFGFINTEMTGRGRLVSQVKSMN